MATPGVSKRRKPEETSPSNKNKKAKQISEKCVTCSKDVKQDAIECFGAENGSTGYVPI